MASLNLFEVLKKWIIGGLEVSIDVIRIMAIIFMVILVFIQVILRIFFKWSSPVWEEMSRFLLIWSIMAGIIVTSRKDEHLKMDFLDVIVHSPGKRLIFEVGIKSVCFFFLCFFVWWSWDFLMWSIRVKQQSYILLIPMYTVHSAFVFCAFLSASHFLHHLIKSMKELIHSRNKEA